MTITMQHNINVEDCIFYKNMICRLFNKRCEPIPICRLGIEIKESLDSPIRERYVCKEYKGDWSPKYSKKTLFYM